MRADWMPEDWMQADWTQAACSVSSTSQRSCQRDVLQYVQHDRGRRRPGEQCWILAHCACCVRVLPVECFPRAFIRLSLNVTAVDDIGVHPPASER